MEKEKVIDKVRKLLNLANDAAATEGERDNAMRMAHGFLAKYNLDMAEVEAAGGTVADEPREETAGRFFGRPWARSVAGDIGRLFFCYYIYIGNSNAKMVKHVFIGKRSNAITALEMAQYVVGSIIKEGKSQARKNGLGHTWFRSFALGAAESIDRRVEQIILSSLNQKTKLSTGKELVLASIYEKEKKLNVEMSFELYPRRVKSRTGLGTGSRDGFESGKTYGNTVSLNRQVTGHVPKKLTYDK